MGAITGKKEPVLVNPNFLIVYLIESSLLLIKCLLSFKKVLTKVAMGLWKRAEESVGPGAKNNKPAGPETKTGDKQAGMTSDSCT